MRACKCDKISKCRNIQYCKFHTAQIAYIVTIVRMSTDECGIVGHYSIVINLAPLIYTTIGDVSPKSVLKIRRIFSRTLSIRQRSWRRFFGAYISPIRDLCATAFCDRFLRLSFVFYDKIISNAVFRRCLHCVIDASA